MKKSLVYLAVVAVVSVVFPMPAMAVPISINNHSFETQNPFTNSSTKGNWVQSVLDWQLDGNSGTFRPSTPGNHFVTDVFGQDVPDGFNTAYINSGSIWQVLTTTLAAGTTYDLTVEVGARLDNGFPEHSLQLRAGGTTLASASASPLNGQFDLASLTYSTAAGDPIGTNLEIWLVRTGGGQVNWDNVQLNASGGGSGGAPVPEPSTMVLMGSGLLGLVGYNVRRRKQAV